MSSGTSKHRSRGRRGGAVTPPASTKPRTLEHFCKPCSLVAKGDERDCTVCAAALLRKADPVSSGISDEMMAELIAEKRAEARGAKPDPRLKGAGAREMGRYDINGKPWGYKPINSYIRGWRPKS